MRDASPIQPGIPLGRISFAETGAPPPAPLVVGRGDKLFIRSHNSVSGVSIALRGRLLETPDQIVPQHFEHVPSSDRTVGFEAYNLAAGFLLGLHVFASAGTVRRGQCYVQVGLLRGTAAAVSIVQTLFAGYITEGSGLGWPGGRILQSIEGPGVLRSITGTDPGVATEISESVPTNARWRFWSMQFSLATDANVGNRIVLAQLTDGTNPYATLPIGILIPENVTGIVSFHPTGTTSTLGIGIGVISTGAGLTLPAGHRINTLTSGIQAGDNFSVPQLLVEEWIED